MTEVDDLKKELNLARSEIKNLRSQIISLKFSFRKDCEKIERQLVNGIDPPDTRKTSSEPEGCGCEFAGWRSIGVINTWFPGKRGVPRQAALSPEAQGVLTLSPVVINNPAYSLSGLAEFSHVWIIFHFHQTCGSHVKTKVAPPRLGGARVGVFGTRSPHRPCPIGLSLVKLNRIDGNSMYFSGVDMVDGTPVFDIKPYIPQYDDPRCLPIKSEHQLPDDDIAETRTSDSYEQVSADVAGDRLVEGEAGSESPILGLNRLKVNDEFAEIIESSSPNSTPTEGASGGLYTAVADGAPSPSQGLRSQREAPDGEEEPQESVQVASWINNPPAGPLQVCYDERALQQLSSLPEHDALRATVTRLLEQDPRSNYLRRKLGSQFYTFRIDALYVSVKFDDVASIVTVNTIQQAV